MKKDFLQNISLATLHLDKNKAYLVKDSLTGEILSEIKKGQSELKLNSGPADALMVTITPKIKSIA
jgi:hypothetical protein